MRVDLEQRLRNQPSPGPNARASVVADSAGLPPSFGDIVGDFGRLIGVLLLLALIANLYVIFFAGA